MTTTKSVAATRARSGQPVRVGLIGLGAREDLWACLAHLPAVRAVPGFEVTALSLNPRMGWGPAVLVGCYLGFRCVGAGYWLVCPAFPVLRSGLSAVVRLVWLAVVGAGRLC